jgi:CheY-like chemotaxis protein
MSGFSVGLLVNQEHADGSVRRNLETYISHTGASFSLYNEESVLDSMELPDILFIDHTFHERAGELEKYLDIRSKIVLMTTVEKKKNIEMLLDRIDRILYKPLNLSKTFKALEVVYDEKVRTAEKPQVASRNIVFENLHVMVAEDNSINQKLIKNVLNSFGIEVTLASNGEEAVNLRMQNEYDMIFMDIQMPVLGGIEATHEIIDYEEKNRKHHIPIVALTANALSGDREKYMNEGMDNYLSKPIDLERLNILLQEYFPMRVKTEENELLPEEEQEVMQTENSVEENTEAADSVLEETLPEIIADDEKAPVEKVEETEASSELLSDILADIPAEEEEEISAAVEKSDHTEQKADELEDESRAMHKDVLIYHSFSLISDLYERILENLGYSVDKVMSEEDFMDRIEDTKYMYVLFEGRQFLNIKCLISDMVRGIGAKPFVIISSDEKNIDFCCDVLEEGSHINIIKAKLEAEDQ